MFILNNEFKFRVVRAYFSVVEFLAISSSITLAYAPSTSRIKGILIACIS